MLGEGFNDRALLSLVYVVLEHEHLDNIFLCPFIELLQFPSNLCDMRSFEDYRVFNLKFGWNLECLPVFEQLF